MQSHETPGSRGEASPARVATEAAVEEDSPGPLLRVQDLEVEFQSFKGRVRAVGGVSFDVRRGELVAMVGESGSGKSVTAMSIMGLLDENNSTTRGRVVFRGQDLRELSDGQISHLRGAQISMIFQDPLSALNPLVTVGRQVRESLLIHGKASKADADLAALRLLRQVEMPDPAAQFRQYPHQLSGGMNQRAMIAMALACDPVLLIADEPTTALDATTQVQIMDLLRGLARTRDMAVLLITHDLGLVSDFADRVLILYAGRLMEDASREQVFTNSFHPYSRALLKATPRGRQALHTIPGSIPDLSTVPPGCVFNPRCELRNGRDRCVDEVPELRSVLPLSTQRAACHFAEELERSPASLALDEKTELEHGSSESDEILRVQGLTKWFNVKRRFLAGKHRLLAVDDVNLTLRRGETLALVGESGSGKSTTARLIVQLLEADGGSIKFNGHEILNLNGSELRRVRREMGLIFQDPDSSLDPYMTAGAVVVEPMVFHGVGTKEERDQRSVELMQSVGLAVERRSRRPRQFSGGERQRLAIARALSLKPSIIVCDEPTTMLDVSVQAQILTLLKEIQETTGVAYLFIAHDLAVVQQIAHRVAVMYAGRIIESCSANALFSAPHHPYTVALLSATPDDPTDRQSEEEQLASRLTIRPPDRSFGCPYATTCWKAENVCREVRPPLEDVQPGHPVACHFPENVNHPAPPASVPNGKGAA